MLTAFACTAFVAVLPVLFLVIRSSGVGPVGAGPDTDGGYGGLMLGAGSVVATALLVAACMLTVAIGRRVVRRPSRA